MSAIHGRAHAGAGVPSSPAAMPFVWIVILVGPLGGFGLSWWHPVAAGWVVAASMGGALLFGLVNHFMVAGPDHVSHVAAPWHATFAATAALLVVAETAGVGVGLWHATRRVE